jgi:hypothetical protein
MVWKEITTIYGVTSVEWNVVVPGLAAVHMMYVILAVY